VFVQEGNQKIENLFLAFGQCHRALPECRIILGEVKANSQGFSKIFSGCR
jgi:hypothetical protein